MTVTQLHPQTETIPVVVVDVPAPRPNWGSQLVTQMFVDHTTPITATRDETVANGAEFAKVTLGELVIYVGNADVIRLIDALRSAYVSAV